MGNKSGNIAIKQQNPNYKPLIMKNANKLTRTMKNLDQLISIISEKNILDVNAMISVRGGDGTGGEVIIIIPKRP